VRKANTLWTACKYYLIWWAWVAPSYWHRETDGPDSPWFSLFLLLCSCAATYVLFTSKHVTAQKSDGNLASPNRHSQLIERCSVFVGEAVIYITATASGLVVLDAIYPRDPIEQLWFDYNYELISGACILIFSVLLGQGAYFYFLQRRSRD